MNHVQASQGTIVKEGVARLVADHEVAGRLISEARETEICLGSPAGG